MEQRHASVETLILGNSHAYSGIRPSLLPGVAVNLANVSQVPGTDLELLERYAPRCPHLKHVYLVCDNSNLFDLPMESTDEWWRCTYYNLYMDGLGGHSRMSRYGAEIFHFESFKGKLTKYWSMHRPDCDSLGWNTDNSLQAKNQEEWNTRLAIDALQRHTCKDWQQARRNVRHVFAIARYCLDRHIRLTLIATPVSPAYGAGIPARQRAVLQRLYRAAHDRFGAESLDFSRFPMPTDDDYFDGDHLTHEGAARFTKLLAEEAMTGVH